MALRLALQSPLSLAGAASLGGPLPRGNCPLARVNAARRLPLMLMTCSESRQYPAPRVAEDLRLLHAAGCHAGAAAVSVRRRVVHGHVHGHGPVADGARVRAPAPARGVSGRVSSLLSILASRDRQVGVRRLLAGGWHCLLLARCVRAARAGANGD